MLRTATTSESARVLEALEAGMASVTSAPGRLGYLRSISQLLQAGSPFSLAPGVTASVGTRCRLKPGRTQRHIGDCRDLPLCV